MKVLIIAPYTGGIDVYARALKRALENAGAEVNIEGGGEPESPYNKTERKFKTAHEVKELANQISSRIRFADYDIVAFNYGKNDIEQYLPVALTERNVRVPNPVYFVHYLSRNLFDQYLGDPLTQAKVEDAVATFFRSYIFFGKFSKSYMERKLGKKLPGKVAYHPEAHSQMINFDYEEVKKRVMPPGITDDMSKVFFSGFPANYKDHELLLKSLEYVGEPFNLIFSGPGWKKKLPSEQFVVNKTNVYVVDKYLDEEEFLVTVKESDFGIFPYHQPVNNNEVFQGSGTLPNYIYQGKPSIVLNDGVMPEYVADSGIIVDHFSPEDLGQAVNSMLNHSNREQYHLKALERSNLFSQETHGKTCYDYFSQLLK